MESPELSPPHLDQSRLSLGFPLGTALLLLAIFTLSGIFSCCYHWDKARSLRRSAAYESSDIEQQAHSKSAGAKCCQNESLPVLMPGDEIPKFIAMPCPCEPRRQEAVNVKALTEPPKIHRFPVPLY
ncbi:hypothetical protein MLD38_008095 [Melastoma candidum]|uniref:Uncharacterized protein n=1 Tax=Melastoma candidum TaxID=119954 RepID=A0ACB9RTD7_9MYRT|nr:hypothetical protein MLD38_008095 [Melastoma candidum]